MTASLTFLGATGIVTGSRFLVEDAGRRVLVDCGLFQGLREDRRRNWEEFPVDPATIDAVVLTHAHLDHCGYLPALVKQGFTGPVWCTPGTARLTEIVLRDSAHLQEEDAAAAREGGWSRHDPPQPLYDAADAERALTLLGTVELHEPVTVAGGVTLELFGAGHILGSSSALLTTSSGTLLVSGDLGRPHHPLLASRERRPPTDVVVVESTYGDRTHPAGAKEELADVVRRTLGRGGTVLIPAFAVDRTEIVLTTLAGMMRDGRIPTVPVYVDSPMALKALRVYRDELGVTEGPESLDPPVLHEAPSWEDSARIDAAHGPRIVISASGMASGGRVVHHLASMLPDRRNSVVLVGYQAQGTRGRALLEGARTVKVHGEYVPVRAEVVSVEGLSVHADADELLDWLRGAPEPHAVYVVHGERRAAAVLSGRIHDELGWCAVVPRDGERVLVQ